MRITYRLKHVVIFMTITGTICAICGYSHRNEQLLRICRVQQQELLDVGIAANVTYPGYASEATVLVPSRFGAASVRKLREFKGITHLDLTFGNHKLCDDICGEIASIESIRALSFDGNEISDEGLQRVLALPYLEKLNISNLPLSDGRAQAIGELSRIRELNVSLLEIKESQLAFLGKLSSLETMALTSMSELREPDTFIDPLSKILALPKLTYFRTNLQLTEDGVSKLKHRFPHVRIDVSRREHVGATATEPVNESGVPQHQD